MNKQLMIVGAMTAARIFGDAVGRWVRKNQLLLFCALLGICLIGASCEISQLKEQNWDLQEENAYLVHNCMVLGEQGDILVPIEALEGDDNWKLR